MPDPHSLSSAAFVDALPFLAGGGEMGALMRAHDWSHSTLGPPQGWPVPLRTVVRLMLNSGHPMYVWWGADGACLYNDAYRASIGAERHPSSLGRPAREVWAEIWPIIGPQIEQVMSGGGATWNVDALVPITRNGRLEDVYWTYSYSPIDDDAAPGGIGGVMVLCTETTAQVQAAQRVAAQRDQFASLFEQAPTFMALLSGPEHRFEVANPSYLQLVGHRELLGMTVAEALPEVVAQGYVELLDQVFRSGEAFSASASRLLVQQARGAPVELRYVDFVYQPIKDAQGTVTGIFVQGSDATHRVRVENDLRESEARFRAALTAGRMGSWETDNELQVRHWSAEGMALFGLDLPDGRGRVGGDDDEFVAALHPDDRHFASELCRCADTQDSFPADYRVVHPDGTTLWLSGRGLVVARNPDGTARRLISIMADATERKRAEARLLVEHERLELALNAGRMGAFDTHIGRGELWWAERTYALFGVDPAHFVPTPQAVLALVHPDDREPFVQARDAAIAGQHAFTHELRVQRPDGKPVWLALRGQVEYTAGGTPLRHFGVVMDITERKEAEELLRDADRKKDRFIATLAHELRNPLAPMRNAVHLLRKLGDVGAKAAWCYDVIDRQVTQMARLLDDLLDASRLSRGQLRLRLQSLDLRTAIEQAVEIAQPQIDAAGHALTLDIGEAPMPLQGDMTRLAQVFSNLLINAAKYTPRGGRIALTARRVDDAGHGDGHDAAGDVAGAGDHSHIALVRVTDSGIGIEAGHLAPIFEMFGQVESALTRSQGGQGIGLALARGLAEMHGGSVTAHSDGAGHGSTFEVRLPLAPPMPPAGAAHGATDHAHAAHAAGATPLFRILVADDLRDSADSLAFGLQALGHSVRVAYDGAQALQMATDQPFDVILLDLGMPGLNGLEACRAIRALPGGQAPTIIAQTGWGQAHDRQRTLEAGFDHHLVKPIDLGVLAALLAQHTTA